MEDLQLHRALTDMVEKVTDKRSFDVDLDVLRRLKLACQKAEEAIPIVFTLNMERLRNTHARVSVGASLALTYQRCQQCWGILLGHNGTTPSGTASLEVLLASRYSEDVNRQSLDIAVAWQPGMHTHAVSNSQATWKSLLYLFSLTC